MEFVFSNDVKTILDYNSDVLTCDIHTREKTTKLLKAEGANVYGLHEVLKEQSETQVLIRTLEYWVQTKQHKKTETIPENR